MTDDLLSQEEIDALLEGVDSGEIDTGVSYSADDDDIRPFDFGKITSYLRRPMPTLDRINERFSRELRSRLYKRLRRPIEVSLLGMQTLRFAEYQNTLQESSSRNAVQFKPLQRNALLVLESALVFSLVDHFFGGTGRYSPPSQIRDFTPAERWVIRTTLDEAFAAMRQAWSAVLDIELEHVKASGQEQSTDILSPTEVVVVSAFLIDLQGVDGAFHVALPQPMLESIRDLLAVDPGNPETGSVFSQTLRREVVNAEVAVSSVLSKTQVTLRQVMNFRPGDIVPIQLPEQIPLLVEGVPVFWGRFGQSNGHNAVQIMERLHRARWVDSKSGTASSADDPGDVAADTDPESRAGAQVQNG